MLLAQLQYVCVLPLLHVVRVIQQLLFQPLIELRVVLPQPFHVVHVQLQNVLFLPPHGPLFRQLHGQSEPHVLVAGEVFQLGEDALIQPVQLHIFHEQLGWCVETPELGNCRLLID